MPEIVDLERLLRARFERHWRGSPSASEFELDASRCSVAVLDFQYEKISIDTQPRIVATSAYINDTDLPANQQFADSKSTSASFAWTLQKGTSFTISASVTASVPQIASASIGASATFSTSETQAKTVSVSQSWSWNASVPVPPRSRVEASVEIKEATYSPKFTARVRYSGKIHFVYKRSDGHNHVEIACIQDLGAWFTVDPDPNVAVIDGLTVEVVIGGQFKGVQGLSYLIVARQFSLDSGNLVSVRELQQGRRAYVSTAIPHLRLNMMQASPSSGQLLDDTIGPPNGIYYQVIATRKEVRLAAVQCGFNDIGLPNPGLFQIETRWYQEFLNGQLVRAWVDDIETFEYCQPV